MESRRLCWVCEQLLVGGGWKSHLVASHSTAASLRSPTTDRSWETYKSWPLVQRRDGTSREEWNAFACTYKLNLCLSCHVQIEFWIALHKFSAVLWEQEVQKWANRLVFERTDPKMERENNRHGLSAQWKGSGEEGKWGPRWIVLHACQWLPAVHLHACSVQLEL